MWFRGDNGNTRDQYPTQHVGVWPYTPLTTPKAQRIASTADDATEKLEQKMMAEP